MALNIRAAYKQLGANLIQKQLVDKGIPPEQASAMARDIVGGKQPPPANLRIPKELMEPPGLFGMSYTTLAIVGVAAAIGIGFLWLRKK